MVETRASSHLTGRNSARYTLVGNGTTARPLSPSKQPSRFALWAVAGLILSGVTILLCTFYFTQTTPHLPQRSPSPQKSRTTEASADLLPLRQSARVLSTYFHDAFAFTQGLSVHQGYFLESTGLTGESVVRMVNIDTGTTLKQAELPASHFGEGSAVIGDTVYVLTWK